MVKKSNPSAPPLYPELPQVIPDDNPQLNTQVNLQPKEEDEGKTFRLKRISDIREFLEKELETRGRYRRRYKSIYNTAIYVNAGAGLTSVASGVAAATALATGIGVIASIPLGFTAVATGVLGVISTGTSKLMLKKVEKHQQIKLIAAAKLSSVNGLVSRALQDGSINNEEYQIILQEMESFRDHKSQIRNRTIGEKRDSRRKFKKRYVKRSRNGYGQPPAYNDEYTSLSTAATCGSSINFNLICCSYNNNIE